MPNVLNYKGNRVLFDARRLGGPDMDGAFYRPVSAFYNAISDCTAITFRPVPPADLPPEAVLAAARQLAIRTSLMYREALLGKQIIHVNLTQQPSQPPEETRHGPGSVRRSPRKNKRSRHKS